jgi:site-specific DNA-methyltransferase (adenine-specific)
MDKSTQKLMFSSKSNDWATPQSFFDKLDGIFGPFTLDAAASSDNYKVSKHYTESDDSLSQDWSGNRVFLNPPYGRNLKDWVKKAYEEGQKDNTTVVMLIPARTDTKYWHDYVMKADEIRFVRGRIKFGDETNSAPFPSAVIVFRQSAYQAPRITGMEKS